jgi:predicted ATPase/class 3 adenylate cyclase
MNPETMVSGAFLFSDVEGSTGWWERDPTLMQQLMSVHDDELDRARERHGGELIKRTGDGMLALFPTVVSAVEAAVDMQLGLRVACELAKSRTEPSAGFRVRIGIHSGEAMRRSGDLHGPAVHRAARVMTAGHGGQVLVSGTALETIPIADRPHRWQCEPLGLHRLRGLATPEVLVRVSAAGMETVDRPVSSLNAATGNLAPLAKPLVGRNDDLRQLLLAVDTGVVTTLVGPGGVGKTSLVRAAGESLRSSFPDGVWFVDLTPMTTEGMVPFTVATMLGLAGRESELPERLRTALTDGTVLLILDNCEHVIDEVARLVEQIVPLAGSGSRIVCTSQRPLKLRSITGSMVSVMPLPVPDIESDLATFAASASVTVFIDRLSEVRPEFTLTESNRAAVGSICARLDGLPLALELAAARATVLEVDAIAQRLDQRFSLLRTRADSHRHAALVTTIGWSVDLLDERQLTTFAALSLFSGRFDLEAAVALLGSDEFDVIDDLQELVDRSLLSFVEGKYRQLSSIRDYGAGVLAERDGAHEYRSRHATWALTLAKQNGAALTGDTFHAAQAQLVDHIDDLRSAHQFLVGHAPSASAELVNALAEFFLTGDYLEDALSMSEASLAVVTDPRLRVDLLGVRSVFAWTAGHTADVVPMGEEAISVCESAGLPFPALAGVRLAVHHVFSGRPDDAERLARAAVGAVGDDTLLAARVLGVAAVVIGIGGDLEAALHLAQAGVDASAQIGPIRSVSALANQLMILSKRSPQHQQVAEQLESISRSIGRLDGVGQALVAVAEQLIARGEVEAAVSKMAEAVEVLVRTGRTATVPGIIEKLFPVPGALSDEDALVVLGATEALRTRLEEPGSQEQIAVRQSRLDAARATVGLDSDVLFRRGLDLSAVELVDLLRWLARKPTMQRVVE